MNPKHGLTDKTVHVIHQVLSKFPEVERAVLFGSRAKGNFKTGSDIDLALLGGKLGLGIINRIDRELDDSPLPYRFSLAHFDKIRDPEVLAHISRVGVVFYEKDSAPANLGA